MRVALSVLSSVPAVLPPAARLHGPSHPWHPASARMLAALLGLLWAALATMTLPAAAADTITAIEVAGNRTVDAGVVRANLALAVGSPYDGAKADQSIKALYGTGLFHDVRIERHGTKLHVTVSENPIVARVELEGKISIDKNKLQEAMQLKARARYTASKAHADAIHIRDA